MLVPGLACGFGTWLGHWFWYLAWPVVLIPRVACDFGTWLGLLFWWLAWRVLLVPRLSFGLISTPGLACAFGTFVTYRVDDSAHSNRVASSSHLSLSLLYSSFSASPTKHFSFRNIRHLKK